MSRINRSTINQAEHTARLQPRAAYPLFSPGDDALVKGSFEVVTVKAQSGNEVLVLRAGGQTTYRADQLEPYDPDFCPLP